MPMCNCSECRPIISLQDSVLTVLSMHRVCVLWTLVVTNVHTCVWTQVCSFGPYCRSHQKMILYRRSSRMSHRVWQLGHYTWWITSGGFCWSQSNRAPVSTDGSGREGDGKENKLSHYIRRRVMNHNVRQLPRRLREKAAKEVCLCSSIRVCVCVCVRASLLTLF